MSREQAQKQYLKTNRQDPPPSLSTYILYIYIYYIYIYSHIEQIKLSLLTLQKTYLSICKLICPQSISTSVLIYDNIVPAACNDASRFLSTKVSTASKKYLLVSGPSSRRKHSPIRQSLFGGNLFVAVDFSPTFLRCEVYSMRTVIGGKMVLLSSVCQRQHCLDANR